VRGLLSAAGRAFLRAFVGSLLILLPGVLSAPNLDESFGLGVAALIASISAGVAAVQVFVPQLTVPGRYGSIIADALRAFLATFLPLVTGVLSAPDLNTARAAGVAALVAAVTAAIRALQGYFTPGEHPNPQTGFATEDSPRPVGA